MPRVVFTTAVERHIACPPESVDGATMRAALDAYFARHAAARACGLGDQATLRHHVVVFVDGVQVRDRAALDEAVAPAAEIRVMQALGSPWELARGKWDQPKRKEWFGGGADMPGIHLVCEDEVIQDPHRVVQCGSSPSRF